MTTKVDVTIEQLEATLAEFEALVAKHGAMRVGGALAVLTMKNREVAGYMLMTANHAVIENLKDRADVCQCENCRAQRGQA